MSILTSIREEVRWRWEVMDRKKFILSSIILVLVVLLSWVMWDAIRWHPCSYPLISYLGANLRGVSDGVGLCCRGWSNDYFLVEGKYISLKEEISCPDKLSKCFTPYQKVEPVNPNLLFVGEGMEHFWAEGSGILSEDSTLRNASFMKVNDLCGVYESNQAYYLEGRDEVYTKK